MGTRPRSLFVIVLLALALVPATAWSQSSAAELLRTALAQHEARMQNVENYTIVHSTMGIESTAYFERVTVDGRTRFVPRSITAAGLALPVEDDGAPADPYAGFERFAEHARLQGTERVDGRTAHVLVIDDAGELADMVDEPGDAGEFEVQRITLYLDAADHLMRKMTMEGTTRASGQAQPITVETQFEDYRDVQGVVYPFRTVMTTRGIAASVPQQELEEARRNLEEMRAQMENMPAAQREMVERMIRPQMEQFERMMEGGDMTATIEVTDLRVNAGPPGER